MPKSDYIRVSEIISHRMKPDHRYNRYVSLQLETKDVKLGDLLSNHIYYIDHCKKYPRLISQYREGLHASFNALKSYVEDKIKSDKPAWQIEAEKHGWRNINDIRHTIRVAINEHEEYHQLCHSGLEDAIMEALKK